MPSMTEVIDRHTTLAPEDRQWLGVLVGEWQLLADLAFSDLVLWVPEPGGNVFWAAAQVRPTTGPTALVDDVVGELIAYSPEHPVSKAFASGETVSSSIGKLQAGIPVGVQAVPARRQGRTVAVVEEHTNQLAFRSAGMLEETYRASAVELTEMVRQGDFPNGDHGSMIGLRVGDGLIRTDERGVILFASPNALSAYRRLGLTSDLVSEQLASLTAELVPVPQQPIEDTLSSALSGRTAREIEVVAGAAHVLVRLVPLVPGGRRSGAIVLCRDVTDLRRKERELLSKEATIREIHHRVKNNLQTVAALLRMQSRRIDAPLAKQALTEAMSRVSSIAMVHDTLSQAFDEMVEFDRVADQILRIVADVAVSSGTVQTRREGSFGVVPSGVAANLSLVLTELCQNAIEHGVTDGAGDVLVRPAARDGRLTMEVLDRGPGLPAGFTISAGSRDSMGLSIVDSLITELEGSFELVPRIDGIHGTRAIIDIPLSENAG
jgi:two-component sensor histidine kinase